MRVAAGVTGKTYSAHAREENSEKDVRRLSESCGERTLSHREMLTICSRHPPSPSSFIFRILGRIGPSRHLPLP